MSTSAVMANYNPVEALGVALPEYKFKFPDGEVITMYYDDSLHQYTRYGLEGVVILPSSTTAIHIIDKSAALTQWAANMTVDYIRQKMATEVADYFNHLGSYEKTFTPENVESWLNDARFNFKEYTKAAADTGTLAHDWLEEYIKADKKKDNERLMYLMTNLPDDERAKNGITAALDWMSGHNVKWIHTERKIFSREYDFAGTMDGLAYIDSCGEPECTCCGTVDLSTGQRIALEFVGVLALIDWKTSNRLYPEYWYQTASYEGAYEEETGEDVRLRIICRLGKDDGQFECQRRDHETFEQDYTTFLHALALYRDIEWQKENESARKSAIKFAVKAAKTAAKDTEKEVKRIAKEAAKAAKVAEREAVKANKPRRGKTAAAVMEAIAVNEVLTPTLRAHLIFATIPTWNGSEWVSNHMEEA